MMADMNPERMEQIVSLCKRRGFIFQGSEIYGGLAGTWDYGPYGLALKKNIEDAWRARFVDARDDMYPVDTAILMNAKVWEASGHVAGFSDPLVECSHCKKRARADHVLEAAHIEKPFGEVKDTLPCPYCGKVGTLSEPRQFNMMFKTSVGSVEGEEGVVYLRPETAQGMFVNFKNILDSYHPKLPFGIAQMGRAFRNEIAPRDFIFRVRELEIMEFEYFLQESVWQEIFSYWQEEMRQWFSSLGFAKEDIEEVEVLEGERAHYSKRTVDFHFKYPIGFKEIAGLAYRGDFDLRNHIDHSNQELRYSDPVTGEKILPHVIEPTFGVGRHLLAVLAKAYTVDDVGGEERTVLKFPPHLAPIKAAVFPLLRNKPELLAKAKEIYTTLKREIPAVLWDDNGNIGKRYRRQDEIGTPWCITVDFDTLTDGTVTLRDRDTGIQTRVEASELTALLTEKIRG